MHRFTDFFSWRRSRFSCCSSCLAVLVALPLAAAPLDPAVVPGDAVWLMHLDMDAARASTVMKRVHDRVLAMHPHAGTMFEMAAKMTGSDPRKDLAGVTVFGFDTNKRNAVMVVRGRANREFLTRMVEKAPDHRTMEHQGRTLHSWTHKRGHGGHAETLVGGFFADDVIVIARSEAHVKNAFDVLDGKQPAVAADSPLAGRVRPGSILVARAAAVNPDTKCPVLRQGKAFRVALGEHEGTSFYRARLAMDSSGAAGNVEGVVKGFVSLVMLRWGEQESVKAMAAAVQTAVEGDTCDIAWDGSAEEVWKIFSKVADEWEKRQRDRRSGGKDGCPACGKSGCPGCPRDGGPSTLKKGAEKPLRDDEF